MSVRDQGEASGASLALRKVLALMGNDIEGTGAFIQVFEHGGYLRGFLTCSVSHAENTVKLE